MIFRVPYCAEDKEMRENISHKKLGNSFFVFFLLYILTIIETEWINFILYFCDVEIKVGIAEGISLIICLLVLWINRKKVEISPVTLNYQKLIGIFIIAVFGFTMAVYPDQSFDTFNYHLIAQNPHFENYFTDDYGYGNFQVWGFRLPDRLFYYFRWLLGYRLGTLLNPIVLIISFIQLYELLDIIFKKSEIDKEKFIYRVVCNRTIWALAILLPLDAMFMCGTYYVDIIALPIALEVLCLLLDYDKKQSTMDVGYFAILNGIWIGLKLTNIIYVIPCVLIYLFFHIKQLKIKEWFWAIILGLYPFGMYLIFNYACTGNPIFPYYNSIFKSEFFSTHNFKDVRWGGTNLLEKIFWVVYAAFRPAYRQSEIYDFAPGTLIVGLLGTTIIVLSLSINCLRKKRNKVSTEYIILLSSAVSSSILWAFTTGYSRYFIFGKTLWGILAFIFVLYMLKKYRNAMGYVFSIVAFTGVIVCFIINMQSAASGRNWSWSGVSWKTFCQQIKNVFIDNDIKTDYEIDADLYMLTDNSTMGVAELIDDTCYMINMNYPAQEGINPRIYYIDKINDANVIYDIHRRDISDIEVYAQQLNSNKLYINSFKPVEVGAGIYELVLVDAESEQVNSVWTSDQRSLSLKPCDKSGEYILSFMFGRYYGREDSPQVKIKVFKSDGFTETMISEMEVDNNNIDSCELKLYLAKEDSVIVKVIDQAENVITNEEVNKVFILNAMLKKRNSD